MNDTDDIVIGNVTWVDRFVCITLGYILGLSVYCIDCNNSVHDTCFFVGLEDYNVVLFDSAVLFVGFIN